MRPINLASRPFRNERLPKVLLGCASLVVFALTAVHGLAVARLLPGRTSKLAQEVSALEEEGRTLREEGTRLRGAKPNPADAARWTVLKDLVDRKVFSWTRLLAVLEASLPKGVRLVAVSPKVIKGQYELNVQAIARTAEDGYELIRVLEERPDFAAVVPGSRTENEHGVSFVYMMRYNPAAAPAPTPAPAASASPEAVPSEAPPAGEAGEGQR